MAPVIARTRAELVDVLKGADRRALVPTMGALHEGHRQLLEHARPLGDALVASIFVNPTQFAPGEDFDAYPRTFDADLATCEDAGVDVVFAPEVGAMYPHGLDQPISVDPGPLGSVLEGASRPTHFRGVLTVVAKLFGLVSPDVAVFGEKDYQQLVLIRQMASELATGIEVVGCPTVRESDGLARSSRNVYLGDEDRRRAPAVHRALRAGADAGPRGADAVLAAAHSTLGAAGVSPDYVALRDVDLGDPVSGSQARLLIAARVGTPRLLDNIAVHLGAPDIHEGA
ncbi:pantoate--beta-alanine ligase [Aeromicrobium sp. CF3.5]|uniref:pantoate--beta-alanine ligase n=1 Tax=Aeromicrobium sp. CF3.5 TaxID=3373078 RepID=UPI003EE47123